MFNVTAIRPTGFLHSSGFNEVIESLAWALSELGHEVGVTENFLSTDPKDTNIIFGAELLMVPQQLPAGSIIYNLEQGTHPNMERVRQLAKGLRVWDYSAQNVETWKSAGHDVQHVPIGYTPNLTRIPKADRQDIDVLFFGWLTPRRLKVIQELKDAGLKVVSTDKCYGGGRDNLISRAKVVLNAHHDGRDLFEIVRVSYLLANGKCVVSEVSRDDDEYRDLHPAFIRVPTDQIVSKCKELVTDGRQHILDCRFVDMERISLDLIRKRDFVETVRVALGTARVEIPALEPVGLLVPCDDPQNPTQKEIAIAKVRSRFHAACAVGDMKDFMVWLRDKSHSKNILEIGVRDGASTSAFLAACEPSAANPVGVGHLTSIDIADCSKLFAGHPQWSFVQADSKELLNLNLGGPFDIIMIDGDHSRMGYKTDLDNAFALTKPGGMILSHDIAPNPSRTLEAVPGSDLPSWGVREEYFAFCESRHLQHEELPGENGMGVITKPA